MTDPQDACVRPMEIRVPDTSSVDEIVDMWIALADGQRDHGSHLEAEANRERIRESILLHVVGDTVLVADTDRIIGFVMFTTGPAQYVQDRSRGVIENLYVRPDRRGQGIGSALLGTAEGRLRDAGVDVIALEVMAPNDDARRFYRKHGYEPHRIEMEKPIADDMDS